MPRLAVLIDAHPQITHARAVRRAAGTVEVYIKTQSGTPDETILTAAREYLSAETRRPLCDNVQVTAALPKDAAVEYSAEYHPAADIQAERQAAREALDNLWRQNARIGASVALSKIIGALDTPSVKKITLHSPAADIECGDGEYIRITSTLERE